MLRRAVVCVLLVGLSALPALSADVPCKEAVAAAFAKQRLAPAFRMVAGLKGETGPVEITVEYIAPDRMRQTIVAPNQQALDTVLVGTRAWSRQGTNWEELMPAIAQTIIAQVREAVVDPPANEVVWYVDGQPFATTPYPYTTRWRLQPGEHTFQVRLGAAKSASRPVQVTVD